MSVYVVSLLVLLQLPFIFSNRYEHELQGYLDSYPLFLEAINNYQEQLYFPLLRSNPMPKPRLSYTVKLTTTNISNNHNNSYKTIPTFTFEPQNTDSCLPLLSPGTIYGAQYSRPSNNDTLANITDFYYSSFLQKNLRLAQIGIPWNVLEQIPNQPNYLIITQIIENCYRMGLIPLLTISAIDTNRVAVPSDLIDPNDYTKLRNDLNWTSMEILNRYALLISVIAPVAAYYGAPYIGIGNEVTSNLNLHPETAYDFSGFIYVFRQFIQNLTSTDIKVGVTFITGDLAHMVSNPQPWLSNLILVSDINPLTYYPLTENFTVINDFSIINITIQNALSILPSNDCLVFQELGFPSGYGNSSSTDGSNQQYQSNFFNNFLPYLTMINQTTNIVRAVSIFQFLDMTPQACEGLVPYYVNTTTPPAFLEYLCTLGLIDILTGEPKLAYTTILNYFS